MSETFYLSSSDPTPLYAQLSRAIQFAIATGKLNLGEQLPTVRQMAVNLRINANTVARVYAELERKGIVETRRGVGTFISARRPKPGWESSEEHLRDLRIDDRGGWGIGLLLEIYHHLAQCYEEKKISGSSLVPKRNICRAVAADSLPGYVLSGWSLCLSRDVGTQSV